MVDRDGVKKNILVYLYYNYFKFGVKNGDCIFLLVGNEDVVMDIDIYVIWYLVFCGFVFIVIFV